MRKLLLWHVAFGCCHLILVQTSFAAIGDFNHRFLNPTPEGGDQFGVSVAATSDLFAIGAPNDNTGATSAGSVYLYDARTNQPAGTINNPSPANSEGFGWSVALEGTNIVISDPTVDVNLGATYLFDTTSGGLLQTFLNPSLETGDQFGAAVAIHQGKVLIGAPYDDTVGNRAGAAYVFDAATGLLDGPALFPVPGGDVYLGTSVAWVGDDIAVGAPGVATVYLFDGATHAFKNIFFTQSGDVHDRFGHSIADVGGNLLVGAPGDGSGSAYLINSASGALLQTFLNPNDGGFDSFGHSVAGSDSHVVVGAYTEDTTFSDDGAAYVFAAGSGALVRSLPQLNPLAGDFFGISVAVGDSFLVGATGVGTSSFGAAYVFEGINGPVDFGDFDGDGDVDGLDFLSWQRRPSPSAADLSPWQSYYGTLTLAAAQAVPEPSTVALFMASLTALVLGSRSL